MKKIARGRVNKCLEHPCGQLAEKRQYLYPLVGFTALLILSLACSTTQEIAPTFIPPTPTPYPSETPLPPPTATPFPNPTELTSIMVPPTPTREPLDSAATGAGCIPNNELKKIRVVGVQSGDTIVVEVDDRDIELLYIGLSAPDSNTQRGQEAAIHNVEMVDGKIITAIHDLEPINGFGQLEAYIIVDNIFVNYVMVREGYVRALPSKTNPSCNETLSQAEEEARFEQIGIWSEMTTTSNTPLPQDSPAQ